MASTREWIESVKDAERRGELLAAVDLAEQGLAELPDELWLKWASVLALARAGATEEAAKRFERYRLASSQDEDIAALGARIAKDVALARPEASVDAPPGARATSTKRSTSAPAVSIRRSTRRR